MPGASKSLPARLTVFEKTNYLFKNWRHAAAGTVVFPGCGFMSFFPKTLRALELALSCVPGMGFAYDCCGLPLAGLAGEVAARRELDRVRMERDILKKQRRTSPGSRCEVRLY